MLEGRAPAIPKMKANSWGRKHSRQRFGLGLKGFIEID